MRTITTYTTTQIATGLANQVERNKVAADAVLNGTDAPAPHTVYAGDDLLNEVKDKLDKIAKQLGTQSGNPSKYDRSALTSTEAEKVQTQYPKEEGDRLLAEGASVVTSAPVA